MGVSSARGGQEAVRKYLKVTFTPRPLQSAQCSTMHVAEVGKKEKLLLIDESHPPSLLSPADDPQGKREEGDWPTLVGLNSPPLLL